MNHKYPINSITFSWQKKDELAIEQYISENSIVKIQGYDFEYEQLFLYGYFSKLSLTLYLEKNEFNIPFLPFYESLQEYYNSEWHTLSLKGLLGALSADLLNVKTIETIRYIIENIGEPKNIIDEKSQGIISSLGRLTSQYENIYVICKYSHLYDEYSKRIIKLLMDPCFLRDNPRFLSLKFILLSDSFDDDYYKDISAAYYILSRPEEHHISEIFNGLGRSNIDATLQRTIFQVCDKNLSKIAYFANNISSTSHSLADFEKEINTILTNKIQQIGSAATDVQSVLSTASELGEIFDILPLIKALEKDRAFVEDTLEVSDKNNLTRQYNHSFRFTNIHIKNYFDKLTKYKHTINKKIADAYAELYPYNYEARLFFLERSSPRMLEEACDLIILIWLEYLRNGLPYSPEFKAKLENYAYEFKRIEFILTMDKFFQLYQKQEYSKSSQILENYAEIDSPILVLERNYYMGLAYYKRAKDKNDLQEALVYMNSVREQSRSLSKVLYERSCLSLLSFIVNITDNHYNALAIEKELIYSISERINYDIIANDNLHRLYRKFAALHPVELAVSKTERSVKYFEKTTLVNEYLMAVVNHIANLLHIGHYDDAFSFSQTLYKQLDTYSTENNIKIIIYALNNIFIAFYKKEIAIPVETITQYIKLINNIPSSPSKIIPYLTIAILLCEENDIKLARKFIIKARCLNEKIKDSYYEYYINANEAAILYLMGRQGAAIKKLQAINNQYPLLCKEEMRNCLIKRANVILDSMELRKTKVIINNQLKNISCRYKLIMDYFLISDIQFWSE